MTEAHIIILAAGASSRFGGIKALAPWKNGTLLSHAIATAQAVSPHVLVVTGAHHDALVLHLTVPHLYNEAWASGMGSSIACAIAALPKTAEIAIILPVDQPLVTTDHLQVLLTAARENNKAAFTQQGDIIGPPVALPRSLFARAMQLGDRGLKHALDAGEWTAVAHPSALCDIDTPEDLKKLA